MSELFMPADRAIAQHLSSFDPTPEIHVFSGFSKGLKESRTATNRNPSTGEKLVGCSHASWLGAIGYLALLDQIGACFKPKNASEQHGNAIGKCLRYFTDLSPAEIDAIYALRCAFAHDFSLYNINQKNQSLTHCFKVFASPDGPVVTLPAHPWSGDYQNKPVDCYTLVNLEILGDLAEDVCNKLFSSARAGTLDVVLQNGSDELLQRYSFYQLPPKG